MFLFPGGVAVAQFPEGDCCRGGYIERIDIVRHGYAHYMCGLGDGFGREAVALGAHDDCQFGQGGEHGGVDGDGVVGECHGCRFKA